MSFIDLTADTAWTNADITNRVQALIRLDYSADDELKAARLARKASPSADDAAFVAGVDAVITAAVAQGTAARADMALLNAVMAYERALQRLALPAVTEPATVIVGGPDGIEIEVLNPAVEADALARMEAFAVGQSLRPEVIDLWALRNPVPEVEVTQ